MKPITEDYLIKLKLPKRAVLSESIPYNEYLIRDNFNIYCHIDKSGNCLFWGETVRGLIEDFFIVQCDTAQAFREIYKALTGHKLVIR